MGVSRERTLVRNESQLTLKTVMSGGEKMPLSRPRLLPIIPMPWQGPTCLRRIVAHPVLSLHLGSTSQANIIKRIPSIHFILRKIVRTTVHHLLCIYPSGEAFELLWIVNSRINSWIRVNNNTVLFLSLAASFPFGRSPTQTGGRCGPATNGRLFNLTPLDFMGLLRPGKNRQVSVEVALDCARAG